MSAYAAFFSNDEDDPKYEIPFHNSVLSKEPVSCSSFRLSIENSIHTSSSIFLGLRCDDYIVVNGSFELRVLRGGCLLNNAHHIDENDAHKIITSNFQSSPVICSTKSRLNMSTSRLLPSFDTVIELRNLDTGIEGINDILDGISPMYYTPTTNYTFELVHEERETVFGIYYDAATTKLLDSLSASLCKKSEPPQSVLIFGASNCGKSTFAKALCNNVVKTTQNPIALMDLDPSRSELSVPGCLSLTVIDEPNFGSFFPSPWCYDKENDLQYYFGFGSPLDQPLRFCQGLRTLLDHYNDHVSPKGIPLVINTPGWTRGFGRELLEEILDNISPSHSVYFSHNNAINIDNYEPDMFEAQDNPDDEILAGFSFSKITTLRGVRRVSGFTQSQLQMHDKMVYFHQRKVGAFDFSDRLLSRSPLRLNYERSGDITNPAFVGASAISVLDYEMDSNVNPRDIKLLVDSCVMAMCLVEEKSFTAHVLPERHEFKGLPRVFHGSSISHMNPRFLSLCIIQSINTEEGFFNVYVPGDPSQLSTAILDAADSRLVLVRGEGEIPKAEILHPRLLGRNLPYVDFETRAKIGGVWKIRHNIRRKNQQ
ncbi:putative polynucleotide 5-hydroxyl-kinase [Clavispora lusitaniae]|uniref:Polynucleotide 5'-hydroxyl-kinase GRC3 n=2 Tax=Clavispora lusitaniae TaxID=36911 RepID=C4Y3T6_CLAL4|nr:uncharacterized protein CLUG_02308 [Clavispora lusitaniae ATCC 42720]KAF5211552.1 Polynucleotide 5'-hydroxyl-kinase grc3 [Clavispora lusitaniae]EEQ38182.1 hypothetical protein CLUG_02308 [Clavispora lusitaniae ATCC 42720]KAF7580410.1 Molybdopterin guanine dinucleotide synthesis protein B family protein [Clavispora lusitaniae]QFZ27977.1 putative polynucleotide 5-hydroxyl-kinase [Clavispora lusitaniae]QFZ32716.1 putative polynucleotide 5-hydroxyl-kinase [Clavispora lusitaniae]